MVSIYEIDEKNLKQCMLENYKEIREFINIMEEHRKMTWKIAREYIICG